MYTLAIETTGAFASAAVMQDGKLLAHINGQDKFSHLQNLMPQVKYVVKESKLSLDDMNVIAVSAGPGSFTGIRIGVSSARALSQATGIPCVAVPSLEALAMNVVNEGKKYIDAAGNSHEGTLICPLLDARRSQVYAGGYVIEGGFPREVVKGAPYLIGEFIEAATSFERLVLLGDGADAYAEEIKALRGQGYEVVSESIRYQDAVSVARLGSRIFAEKGGLQYGEVNPDYMRIAEAERRLREKQLAEKQANSPADMPDGVSGQNR